MRRHMYTMAKIKEFWMTESLPLHEVMIQASIDHNVDITLLLMLCARQIPIEELTRNRSGQFDWICPYTVAVINRN